MPYWSALAIALSILLSASPTRAATQEQKAVGYDAATLIGENLKALVSMKYCSHVLPDKKAMFDTAFDAIADENAEIAKMARDKLIAFTESQEGRKRADEVQTYLDVDARKLAIDEVNKWSNASEICKDLAATNPAKMALYPKFGDRVTHVYDFVAGYPWKPNGCEFRVIFPTRPEVQSVTNNGVQTLRAMTAEDDGFPYIRASCYPLSQPRELAIPLIKQHSEQQLRNNGVRNAEWTEVEAPLGHKLTVLGTRQTPIGLSAIMATTIFIGGHSVLEVLITTMVGKYPSLQSTQFLETIERPQPP